MRNYFHPKTFHYYTALAMQSRNRRHEVKRELAEPDSLQSRWQLACINCGLVKRTSLNDARPRPPLLMKSTSQFLIIKNIGWEVAEIEAKLPALSASLRMTLLDVDKTDGGNFKIALTEKTLPRVVRASQVPKAKFPIFGLSQKGWVGESLDLFPHMLVVGGNGSGKTSFISYLCVHYKNLYPDAEFILALPKGIRDYEHLQNKKGYELFVDVGRMDSFFERMQALEEERQHREQNTGKIYRKVFVFVDEFHLMLNDANADFLSRLTASCRTANINFVWSSQRPLATTKPAHFTNIRNVLDARIAFHVNTKLDSEKSIDTNEAFYIPKTIPGRAIFYDTVTRVTMQTPLL